MLQSKYNGKERTFMGLMDKNRLYPTSFVICVERFDILFETFNKGDVFRLESGPGKELHLKSLSDEEHLHLSPSILDENGEPTEYFKYFKHYVKYYCIHKL